MERHESGEACVIPIILRPTLWNRAPFGNLQVLPANAEPVTSKYWHTPDDAFVDAAKGIRKAVEELKIHEKPKVQLQPQKIALFGYETQGGSSSVLWNNPSAFSLVETYDETYLEWLETKRGFTEGEIIGHTWVKADNNGYAFINHFASDGKLFERSFSDPSTEWQGSWQLIDGMLRTSINHNGIYELDVLANRDGPVYSGVSSKKGQKSLNAYAVLLPSHISHLEHGDLHDDVLTAYACILLVDPHCATAYTAQGKILRDHRRYEEALFAYGKALELDSKYVDAYLGKGRVYLDLKDYNGALDVYKQATKVAPNNTWTWHDKGVALGYLQHAVEAQEAFEQAIKLDPENKWAWFHQAETLAYLAQQAYKKAGQPGREPPKREYYNLMQKATGKCLDGNGTRVYLHDPNAGHFQLWKATEISPGTIVLKHFQSGKVLEATVEKGTYFSEYTNSPSQQWVPEDVADGYKKLRQVATGMVLHGDTNNDVYLQPDNGGGFQAWGAVKVHITSFIASHDSLNSADFLAFEQ
jgi:tetratricopeptide (TPR) repeat protein